MHIYNSNHYSSTMKQIINDCLHSAKENPFAIHYVIVDDPKYYEEIFLKHTDTIFNIELMTLSSFYQKLLSVSFLFTTVSGEQWAITLYGWHSLPIFYFAE